MLAPTPKPSSGMSGKRTRRELEGSGDGGEDRGAHQGQGGKRVDAAESKRGRRAVGSGGSLGGGRAGLVVRVVRVGTVIVTLILSIQTAVLAMQSDLRAQAQSLRSLQSRVRELLRRVEALELLRS